MNKMYVVVNKELEMSCGKVPAQVAHAVARLDTEEPECVIVLEATTEQLRNLDQYLWDKDIRHQTYIDEGVNEVPPYSLTAMAVEVMDDEEKFKIFDGLNLLGTYAHNTWRRSNVVYVESESKWAHGFWVGLALTLSIGILAWTILR